MCLTRGGGWLTAGFVINFPFGETEAPAPHYMGARHMLPCRRAPWGHAIYLFLNQPIPGLETVSTFSTHRYGLRVGPFTMVLGAPAAVDFYCEDSSQRRHGERMSRRIIGGKQQQLDARRNERRNVSRPHFDLCPPPARGPPSIRHEQKSTPEYMCVCHLLFLYFWFGGDDLYVCFLIDFFLFGAFFLLIFFGLRETIYNSPPPPLPNGIHFVSNLLEPTIFNYSPATPLPRSKQTTHTAQKHTAHIPTHAYLRRNLRLVHLREVLPHVPLELLQEHAFRCYLAESLAVRRARHPDAYGAGRSVPG